MKNKIELYEITRADIRNILKDILDVGKVLEKLQGIENKLYFLYRTIDGETEYGVYEKNDLPYGRMYITKYTKPIKDLKILVKKIENDNYSFLGRYENFLKFGQNVFPDGFKKEERISIINIYDKYFKVNSTEDSIEDKGNEIFDNNESLKKEDYFLIGEIDGVQKLLPKTFETIDEVENYIKEYLSDPSRIGTTVHILKKDKSVISEIQIKELTDG